MKIVIDGIASANGEYEFGLEFTNRDLHEIKKISGVRAGEFEEAFEAMDNDLVVAVASIVLRRYGKTVSLDALWDAPLGAIKLDLSDEEKVEEVDAGPPSQTPTESEPQGTSGGVSEPSGNGSSESLDPPARIRPVTGIPSSGTTSGSDPVTSAI